MKINEELLEIYKTLLKETSGREVSDEEVSIYIEIKLASDLVISLAQVDAPETTKQLKAFAAKALKKDIVEWEASDSGEELTDDEEGS